MRNFLIGFILLTVTYCAHATQVTTAGIADGAVTNPKITSVAMDKVTSGAFYFSYMPNGTECADGETLVWVAATDRWICGTGGGGVTYPLLADDGTSAAPSYSFSSDGTKGFYYRASDKIGLSGSLHMLFNKSIFWRNSGDSTDFEILKFGSAGTTLDSGSDTTINGSAVYINATNPSDNIQLATNNAVFIFDSGGAPRLELGDDDGGTLRLTFDDAALSTTKTISLPTDTASAGECVKSDGTDWYYDSCGGGVTSPLQIGGTYSATTPRYSFADDTDSGMDDTGGNIYFVNGGVARFAIAGDIFLGATASAQLGFSGTPFTETWSNKILAAAGSAALPGYTFNGDDNTGIYKSAADTIDFSTNGARALSIESSGHLVTSGTDPTITANCGTSPSVVGDDINGRITVGTGGTATTCTLTFATAWTAAPSCVANDESTLLFVQSTASTTTLVVTAATPLGAGDLINYHCEGYQ